MNWLTPAEAENFGINLSLFDPKTNQTASTAPRPPPTSIESRSRDFVIALNVILSGPTEQYLKILNDIYSDQILYYGKLLPRAEVVDQLTKFIARWPIRSYVARPESIKVQCNNQTSECHINGLLDFDAKSQERGKWSHGVATFDYLLLFRPGARWPIIVNENGSVVTRKLEALQVEPPSILRGLGLAR